MKSASRARRPQPEIREQKTLRNEAAGLRSGKVSASGARKRRADPADEWLSRPPRQPARPQGVQPAEPEARQGRSTRNVAADGTTEKKRPVVTRAKRLKVRAGSQKDVAVLKQLREKRLPQEQLNAERLQKALAFTGYGSRREMEEAIEAKRVSVNGKIATLGDKIRPGDEVRFDGKRVNIKWPDRLPRIVIYHKQEGELVSHDDPEGRVRVFDRLPKLDNSKWISIGRLDFNTSGLLVFTTSGDLANKMMHPRFEVEREYAVRVIGELTDVQKKELLQGVELDDGVASFSRMVDGGGEGVNHWYHVIIKEGRNREVRRMFEHFGMTVSRLIRVRFGMLSLPPRLKRGQFYELNEAEVLNVIKWAGLRLNGQEKSELKQPGGY